MNAPPGQDTEKIHVAKTADSVEELAVWLSAGSGENSTVVIAKWQSRVGIGSFRYKKGTISVTLVADRRIGQRGDATRAPIVAGIRWGVPVGICRPGPQQESPGPFAGVVGSTGRWKSHPIPAPKRKILQRRRRRSIRRRRLVRGNGDVVENR
jgi:hypothetical protein